MKHRKSASRNESLCRSRVLDEGNIGTYSYSDGTEARGRRDCSQGEMQQPNNNVTTQVHKNDATSEEEVKEEQDIPTKAGGISNQWPASTPSGRRTSTPRARHQLDLSDITNWTEMTCEVKSRRSTSSRSPKKSLRREMSRSPLASAKKQECKHDTSLIETSISKTAEYREVKPVTHETLPPPKILDPKREWELAPLKEALNHFIQSDEVFQSPAFKPPMSIPRGNSPTIQNKSTSIILNNKPSKYSIYNQLNGTS